MNGSGGPDTIYLIRHGEKLGDPDNDKDGGPDLSMRGSARAAALPSLFVPPPAADPAIMQACALTLTGDQFTGAYANVTLEAPLQPLFNRPDFLFATAPTGSRRPLETITPLAAALSLTPNSQFEDTEVDCVANEIKEQPLYAGTIVLVCWHQRSTPGARACDRRSGSAEVGWRRVRPGMADRLQQGSPNADRPPAKPPVRRRCEVRLIGRPGRS